MAEIPRLPLAVVDERVRRAARTCRTQQAKNASAPSRRRTTAARKASSSVRPFSPSLSPHPRLTRSLLATRLIRRVVLSGRTTCMGVGCGNTTYSVRRVESRVVRGAPAMAGRTRELRPPRSRQDRCREQARQGKANDDPPPPPPTIHLAVSFPPLASPLPHSHTRDALSSFLGILPPGADVRSRGVRGARGMSLSRGIR